VSCNCCHVVEHSVVEVSLLPSHSTHTHPLHSLPLTYRTHPHPLHIPPHPHTYSHKKCVQKVVKAGADISIHDDKGLTTVSPHGYDIQFCQAVPFMLLMLLAPLLLLHPLSADPLTLVLPASLDSLQLTRCTSGLYTSERRVRGCGGE